MSGECGVKDGKVPAACYISIKNIIEEAVAPLAEGVEEMNKRMYVDNGKPSIQTVLARLSTQVKIQWFFIGGLCFSVLGTAMKVIFF